MSRRRVAASVVLLLCLAVAFGLARGRMPVRNVPVARRASTPAAAHTVSAPTVNPATLRDIFRFAGEPVAGRRPAVGPVPRAPRQPEPVPTAAPGPRLVGLLRRSGKLVAALSLGGEVELAAAGESAAGVHVLAVDGDGVRIRRSDGSEATLRLE